MHNFTDGTTVGSLGPFLFYLLLIMHRKTIHKHKYEYTCNACNRKKKHQCGTGTESDVIQQPLVSVDLLCW